MNIHGHVGIKVGWIYSESSKKLNGRAAKSLKNWDELKFDRWFQEICKGSTQHFLYAKAGLKQPGEEIAEGCPYTAYPKDRRYIVQIQDKKDIQTISPIQERIVAQWVNVAEVCSNLIQARLVKSALLPEDCIKKSNPKDTVYTMLNHWANPLVLCTYPVEDSYRPLRMPDRTYVVTLNKQKPSQKCILL